MECKEQFFNYLQFEKRRSMNTIITYRTSLTQFESYLEYEAIQLNDVRRKDIRGFVVSICDRFNPKTINLRIKALRSFYRYCKRNNRIKEDPTSNVFLLKESKHNPNYIADPDKIIQVLDSIEAKRNIKLLREKLILEMLYGTGMRVEELVSIKIEDLQLRSSKIKVLGKGNKERIVYLLPIVKNLIQEYLLITKKKHGYLFQGRYEAKPNRMYISRVVKKYFPISIYGSLSPHSFRHSFATHLLNNGAPIQGVQFALGHSGLGATQHYLHKTTTDIKNQHELSHPKS